ncbi:proteasome assembly chaperone 1 isoform X1 [Corythoichthys intestinalis]|uniref:proteasome assembly chaperone 1 isoform X1 n=1 Tax=Corythoichthys intestinalis TaxID=161448 RepID=UPI0025A4D038|nr:proteasome assembly chaperone 1 isoform X1 [Corythoichthys intestinalis]XP_061801908.1 proteasome assembly chaperone 1-like [Nerophis lumbriciformis]
MATFFGEVLSVYSRAVEEEDDEEELDENDEDAQIRKELEEKREVRLHWGPEVCDALKSGDKLPCSHFILAVGHNASRFLSVYVLASEKWESVGSASVWNERNQAGSGQQSGCVFFRRRDEPSVIICQLTCYIAEDQQFQWAEKVLDCLQHRDLNVTVLSDCSMADYKSVDYLCGSSTPFLRSLHSNAFSGPPVCPALEQPNILTGLPAAVLNHCQVHRISAVVYQCFSDVIGTDSVTMETYKPALAKLGKAITLDPCPSSDTLRKIVRTRDPQSNLYI